ncbi:membrane protein [Heyndrickxia sporothermodurans]|nr:membrane protein [Heyndrickxia sporothermodurans]
MQKQKSIYAETFIETDINRLWHYTQNPEKHEQWDLRFSHIDYLPRPEEAAPQRFLYQTNIGFGISIKGEGESKGTFEKHGEKTSSLRFWTEHPLSLIREGAGYWKYVPQKNGTKFFTQYQYSTRFGKVGEWFDRWFFRPLMGWATAWSFDCLKLWIEKEIHPRISILRSFMQLVFICTLAFVWIYQGLVPKILYPNNGELELLHGTKLLPVGYEYVLLILVGVFEILLGVCFFLFWRRKSLFIFNNILLVLLGISAFIGNKTVFTEPFNPMTLNILMISISIGAILNSNDLPDAKRCKRTR